MSVGLANAQAILGYCSHLRRFTLSEINGHGRALRAINFQLVYGRGNARVELVCGT